MGDLNIDLMNGSSRGSALFTKSVGLNQIVTEATRITVNTQTLIDVICTSNLDRVVSCNVKSVDAMSNHELISCSLDLKKDTTPMTHTFRNYRNLDIDALTSELKSIPWQNLYDATDIDNKIDFFNSAISRLQDRHIPIVERTFKKPYSPWKTDNVMFLISLQKKARIKFKKSKSQTDFEHYKRIKNLTTSIIRLEKKSYMEQRIIKSPNNLWKSLNTLNMSSKLKKYEIPDTLHDVNFLNEYYINSVPKSNISVINTVNQYMSRNAPQLYDQFDFQLIDDIITLRHLTSIKSNSVGFDGIEIKRGFRIQVICSISVTADGIRMVSGDASTIDEIPQNPYLAGHCDPAMLWFLLQDSFLAKGQFWSDGRRWRLDEDSRWIFRSESFVDKS
nr:unnamed protein product [Callosobruchus analis]